MLNILSLVLPHLTLFGATAQSCSKSFLGLKTWFYYLPANNFNADCSINTNFQALSPGQASPILLIVLAVVDDLLRIAALVAVAFVIVGGFQYITSQGAPDKTKQAQQTIINALIGLVVAILAASIVAFIGGRLAG